MQRKVLNLTLVKEDINIGNAISSFYDCVVLLTVFSFAVKN